MDPQKITEIARSLRNDGDKILNLDYKLTFTGNRLRALNDCFKLIVDPLDAYSQREKFQVTELRNERSPVFSELQLIYDFVQKAPLLCVKAYAGDTPYTGPINITAFRALRRLELHNTRIHQVHGIQRLRAQLIELTCVKSIECIDDVIIRCGADNAVGFIWSELLVADFSYNNLRHIDTSLEYVQYLQVLKLRHNQLETVAAIKCLPYLKSVDLSFNCLRNVPEFHVDANRRLQTLNLCNNLVADLSAAVKLDALIDLHLSANNLVRSDDLLPLSALPNLQVLNLCDNPLQYQAKYRACVAECLHSNAATVNFVLDNIRLTKREQRCIGRRQLPSFVARNNYGRLSMTAPMWLRGGQSSVQGTPTASVSSISSFNDLYRTSQPPAQVRTVEFSNNSTTAAASQRKSSAPEQRFEAEIEAEQKSFLAEKRKIESLRAEFGSDWLSGANAERINDALGMTAAERSLEERLASRKLFNEFLGINTDSLSAEEHEEENEATYASTPTNCTATAALFAAAVTPIVKNTTDQYETMSTTAENSEEQQDELHDVYAKRATSPELNDLQISDTEPDEDIYIVYRDEERTSEPVFLTITADFIREKDSASNCTKAKWSIKILESCERITSSTLRIMFDTMRRDRKQRTYTVEDNLCIELERKLRKILSERELTDMNIQSYRCVNCNNQFAREHKPRNYTNDVHCPNCNSTFVAEIQDLKKAVPAIVVVEEAAEATLAETDSVGSLKTSNSSSADSKSSSSKGSTDSSTNPRKTRANYESDIDIISKTSQSSIEVLERATNHVRLSSEDSDLLPNASKLVSTESSSSSSVTEDASTTQDTTIDVITPNATKPMKSDNAGTTTGFANVLGVIFQSTNKLVTGSKKLIDGSASPHIETGIALPPPACQPYKFNYVDFSDIDHRLKLHLYQNVLGDDEQLKWLVRGYVFSKTNFERSFKGLLVATTKKFYVFEAVAAEHENVSRWLQMCLTLSCVQLMSLDLLPWKLGIACNIEEQHGKLQLLLKDADYTHSLVEFLSKDNNLMENCNIKTELQDALAVQRLNTFIGDETLELCTLLNKVVITNGSQTVTLDSILLIATESQLWLSTNDFEWLSAAAGECTPQAAATQMLSNLVDVQRVTERKYDIHFLDETVGKDELWQLHFEKPSTAVRNLRIIEQFWEKLFGMPLLSNLA